MRPVSNSSVPNSAGSGQHTHKVEPDTQCCNMHVTDMPLSSFSAVASSITRQRLALYTSTMFAKRILCAGSFQKRTHPSTTAAARMKARMAMAANFIFAVNVKR